MRSCFGISAGLIVLLALCAHAAVAEDSIWGQVIAPSPPPGRAIGGHARGCVGGAEALALDGLGYQVMRPSRNRFYGHPITVAFVRELAGSMQAAGHDGLLVGDLGQPRGGPMPQGHRSHQSGLDVDIWFLTAPPRTLSLEERESMSAPSMVDWSRDEVDYNRWTAEQVAMLRMAARFAEVDRIFVNPAIKQELCRTVDDDRSWLAKIRPWWGHDDHLHVGIHCPTGEAECIDRPAIPAGDGCDETLAWWFSKEAEQELQKSRAMPRRLPTLDELPPNCLSVLFDSKADGD